MVLWSYLPPYTHPKEEIVSLECYLTSYLVSCCADVSVFSNYVEQYELYGCEYCSCSLRKGS
jgi:hypothetical protein